MEVIQSIFGQLGVNSSLLVQFALVVVFFLLIKHLFLGKLQLLIQRREDGTTKLQMQADQQKKKAEELSQKYKEKIEVAHVHAQKILRDKKTEVLLSHQQHLKNAEKEAEEMTQNQKQFFENELDQKKKAIFTESDQLAQALVQKITQ